MFQIHTKYLVYHENSWIESEKEKVTRCDSNIQTPNIEQTEQQPLEEFPSRDVSAEIEQFVMV